MQQTRDLLFEIGCEELPAKMLQSLSEQLRDNLCQLLEAATLNFIEDNVEVFATPRRLAVIIHNLDTAQKDYTYSLSKDTLYYKIRIWLESESEEILDKVSKVVYHLHPTFPNPDRIVKTRENNFKLEEYAWGQFLLKADVFLYDVKDPIKLERYLNF